MIYKHSKILTLFSVVICSTSIYAQTSPKRNTTRIIESKDIPLDTTVKVLKNTQNNIIQVAPNGTIEHPNFIVKKDDKYHLEDHLLAAKYDSLWLKELSDSAPLFDEMYEEISELEVDENFLATIDTETLKLRLEKLNQKTPFNIEYNPSLESVIQSFLKRKRGLMERMLTLSQFYFPMFEQELASYNIPLELKYLAIVESALNPRATSRVGATGLWQFMYPTGKMYDLDVSSYVDDRSDPIKATKAACAYLSKLHDIYDDWDLALAAYNSGPGNVNKAIRRSGGYRNYWNIRDYLPRETAGYVPAFLATMYLFEYADEHGLKPKNAERPYFQTDTIHVKRLITFQQISELVDVSVEELEVLNPSYKLNIIPFIEEENYSLRLPLNAIGKFVANEDAIYAHVEEQLKIEEKVLPKLVETKNQIRYRVKSGDFLGKIAGRYGVRVSEIKRWNNLRSNNLKIGQRLTIHSKKPVSVASKTTKSSPKTSTKSAIASATKVYTVKSGDSLWTISNKHPGVSVENLKKWNGISGNNLKLGTKLVLCDCQP
ncbi:LysM peptidoglycan-binding domain-containing protein [Cellulophaga sp. E16_2]|uniref:lytic transglycosylase domain-containing protein n=1 Tax=unclassified Cellulophaga TaxID=2634405 RepID=UPI0013FE4A23|nr:MULTISPECIES: lytic transglycosylase domain-containing protein [unclassified Cellulophaga]MBO0591290.1 LysM peptidoglycan-binding domain-containing protein [Cellulophaga sp. E16_2]